MNTARSPVLDGAADLDEAIASVLAQTLEDFELIVVDDGSADESPAIAAGLAARDCRVRLIRLARDPRTVSGARADNVGQAEARGAFIARMDQDDVLAPERLAVQLALMARGTSMSAARRPSIAARRTARSGFPSSTRRSSASSSSAR